MREHASHQFQPSDRLVAYDKGIKRIRYPRYTEDDSSYSEDDSGYLEVLVKRVRELRGQKNTEWRFFERRHPE